METIPFELVEEAREAVAGRVRRTPLLRSESLSECLGGEVLLKCEGLQVTGSFKIRGALAAVAGLDAEQRERGLVTCSAGNHGRALALAAREAGLSCRVVVPRSVPRVKAEAIRDLGAELVPAPFDGYDDTLAWTLEEEAGSRTWISAFDDPRVVAGNGGTTACEILEEAEELDAIVVPCGGGGCAVGVGVACRERSPATRVLAVNTDASPGMWLSRREGRPRIRVESEPTVAEGIEGGVSEVSWRWANEYVDDVLLVREESIRASVGELARRERLVVEGAGAAGVAALREGLVEGTRICVLLTGSNVDAELLAELLA